MAREEGSICKGEVEGRGKDEVDFYGFVFFFLHEGARSFGTYPSAFTGTSKGKESHKGQGVFVLTFF